MVFWQGSDVMHRPCLIVRLELACNTLASQDRLGFLSDFPLLEFSLPSLYQHYHHILERCARRFFMTTCQHCHHILEGCTCMKCSKIGMLDMQQPHGTGTSRISREEDDISENEDSPSPHPSGESDGRPIGNYDQLLRTAIISVLIFCVFIALIAGMYDPGSGHLPS